MNDQLFTWIGDTLIVYGVQMVRRVPMEKLPLWKRLAIAVGLTEQPRYQESPWQTMTRIVRPKLHHRASKIILVYGSAGDEINAIVVKDRREETTDGYWDAKKDQFTPRKYL